MNKLISDKIRLGDIARADKTPSIFNKKSKLDIVEEKTQTIIRAEFDENGCLWQVEYNSDKKDIVSIGKGGEWFDIPLNMFGEVDHLLKIKGIIPPQVNLRG